MFKNLSERLLSTLRDFRGQSSFNEANMEKILREIRITLLEADVTLQVVHNFIDEIKKNTLGKDIPLYLTPRQELIKIIHTALIHIMGNNPEEIQLNLSVPSPAVILFVGNQGSGKTTSVGKIARYIAKNKNKKVMTVSADIYRPAAIKQLEILSKRAEVDYFTPPQKNKDVIHIVNQALNYAKLSFYDVLLIDTAGRLHTDTAMMKEILYIHLSINPTETLFVLDTMLGQDTANIAKQWESVIPITGIILSKVDSDARGGAALSMKYLTGKPIKFIGIGEDIQDLEPFIPDRLAKRILGMGDVLSLIENIEEKIHKKSDKITKNIKKINSFDFNDFLEYIQQMQKMGGFHPIIDKLPKSIIDNFQIKSQYNEKLLIHMESMIYSMTHQERAFPEIIKGSRKRRIAAGSGMQVQDVNQLLKQFHQIQMYIKKIHQKNSIFRKFFLKKH
ncbi:signal recognition particle protein [Candidatus Schneideria nysicola]|uniref:signal recognition particle protein n=1 Tax=Candidatus Schneideria nysicola TaxID=1081631 RepID=UPI001CAA6ABB|nr:signal recognition particle protein [Candidatus Schneideria nysicola]UAJ64914.1 signal recognition particle protein [Candidatus Schneideria nysicola]